MNWHVDYTIKKFKKYFIIATMIQLLLEVMYNAIILEYDTSRIYDENKIQDLDNIEVNWYRIILGTDQILGPPMLFLIITVEY